MRFAIPEQNFESLEKKLVKIRNKCEKYGCEFKFERVGEHIDELRFTDRETGKEYTVNVKFIDVECEGTAKVNGWQFAASLEYTDNGNIIRAVPGVEVPNRFYHCKPWCEHCKTARDRKYSYVVFSEESGEFKQVGKACLKDFTGGMSAEGAAEFESFFKTIEEASEYTGGFGRTWYKVRDYLVYCAETIRIYGFSKNGGYGLSTSDRASELYSIENGYRVAGKAPFERYNDAIGKGFSAKNAESIELADRVVKWVLENEIDTNYVHNLKVACALEWCDYGKLGLLASAFPAFDRNLEIEAEKAERDRKLAEAAEMSKYVGEIGKRVSFSPKEVVCVTSWETMYGTTNIYKMVDESGNEFTWKTGNFILGCREPIVKITGTVKEHKEYRGVKQTELTRCKIEYAAVEVA